MGQEVKEMISSYGIDNSRPDIDIVRNLRNKNFGLLTDLQKQNRDLANNFPANLGNLSSTDIANKSSQKFNLFNLTGK